MFYFPYHPFLFFTLMSPKKRTIWIVTDITKISTEVIKIITEVIKIVTDII